jgi:hypothetical protein
MTHHLTLELTDEEYQPLARQAEAKGLTVEAIAKERLTAADGAPGSRLRRWAGAFDSGPPDVATRHHEYLGQAIHDELRDPKDA